MDQHATTPPAAEVTRNEIADVLDTAFEARVTTTAELRAHAQSVGARPELLAVLDRLPEHRYASLRELWNHLPDVPID